MRLATTEFNANEDLAERLKQGVGAADEEWAKAYEVHPAVTEAKNGEPIHPVALYLDGVRYTKAIGHGRADSLIGFLFSIASLQA